jgi:phosphoglycolate phosphatase-like HAD superfamily hydrolase
MGRRSKSDASVGDPTPWDVIFFDFDGVLVDSLPVKDAAFRALFRDESAAARREILAYHRREGGLSRHVKFRHIHRVILRRRLSRRGAARLSRLFRENVEERVARRPLVPGTRAFLHRWSRVARLFVVSGSPQAELRRLIRRLKLDAYFGSRIYGSPPEKTALLRRVIRRHRVSASRALFVGDSRNDAEAADACGVAFVARRSRKGDWVRHRGPVVRDMYDLGRWMDRSPGGVGCR